MGKLQEKGTILIKPVAPVVPNPAAVLPDTYMKAAGDETSRKDSDPWLQMSVSRGQARACTEQKHGPQAAVS